MTFWVYKQLKLQFRASKEIIFVVESSSDDARARAIARARVQNCRNAGIYCTKLTFLTLSEVPRGPLVEASRSSYGAPLLGMCDVLPEKLNILKISSDLLLENQSSLSYSAYSLSQMAE